MTADSNSEHTGQKMKRKSRKKMIIIVSASLGAVALILLLAHLLTPSHDTHDAGLIYVQRDLRWAKDTVGASGQTIHAVGCTLCCLSMAFNDLGVDLDPGELNRALKKNGGYTGGGLLVWDAIPKVSGGRLRAKMYNDPADVDIPAALRAGKGVIVRIVRNGGQHWVLIVGRSGSDYLIKDPAGDGKNLDLLSKKYPSGIKSVRIIERAD